MCNMPLFCICRSNRFGYLHTDSNSSPVVSIRFYLLVDGVVEGDEDGVVVVSDELVVELSLDR